MHLKFGKVNPAQEHKYFIKNSNGSIVGGGKIFPDKNELDLFKFRFDGILFDKKFSCALNKTLPIPFRFDDILIYKNVGKSLSSDIESSIDYMIAAPKKSGILTHLDLEEGWCISFNKNTFMVTLVHLGEQGSFYQISNFGSTIAVIEKNASVNSLCDTYDIYYKDERHLDLIMFFISYLDFSFFHHTFDMKTSATTISDRKTKSKKMIANLDLEFIEWAKKKI